MSAQVMGCAPVEGQPASQGQPNSPTRLRARLRAAQAAAAAITTECASSSARVGKRVREDNEAAEPATTDGSKRPATNRRRRASSDGDDERRRRLSSADYSEDVDEVDERIDYVEDVEDEDEGEGTTPHPRRKRRPARRDTGDASALDSKTSLANRFSRIKY